MCNLGDETRKLWFEVNDRHNPTPEMNKELNLVRCYKKPKNLHYFIQDGKGDD